MEGLAVVRVAHRDACRSWLTRHDYALSTIDFVYGVGSAVVALGELLRWKEKFGYSLGPDRRNLDALRDGFDFDARPGDGHVLELLNAEVAYEEDPAWLSGLLSIVREYSRERLALGARFFAVLPLDPKSRLINAPFETLSVPGPFWTPATHDDPFAE